MNKLFKIHWLAALCGLTMLSLTACNDDDNPENKSPEVNPDINVNVETYAGGELGTTFNNSASAYEDPTPATENAGMTDKFKYGEYFFERSYTQNSKPFNGLGPLYIRNSCMNCHPGYGHGKRVDRYSKISAKTVTGKSSPNITALSPSLQSISVTSIIHTSIHILPTYGAFCPFTKQ